MKELVEPLLLDGTEGDKIVAEPATLLAQPLERARHVLLGDNTGADQQIS